jgi:hypothetical protein
MLKNSPTPLSATFSGVLGPSPDGRSSILGRSERSLFRGDRSFDDYAEFFNRIGLLPSLGLPPSAIAVRRPRLLAEPSPGIFRRCALTLTVARPLRGRSPTSRRRTSSKGLQD